MACSTRGERAQDSVELSRWYECGQLCSSDSRRETHPHVSLSAFLHEQEAELAGWGRVAFLA